MRSTYLDHAAIEYKNRIHCFLLLLNAPLGAVSIWRQPWFCCWNRETMMGSIAPLLLVRRVLIVYVSGEITDIFRLTGIGIRVLSRPFCMIALFAISAFSWSPSLAAWTALWSYYLLVNSENRRIMYPVTYAFQNKIVSISLFISSEKRPGLIIPSSCPWYISGVPWSVKSHIASSFAHKARNRGFEFVNREMPLGWSWFSVQRVIHPPQLIIVSCHSETTRFNSGNSHSRSSHLSPS